MTHAPCRVRSAHPHEPAASARPAAGVGRQHEIGGDGLIDAVYDPVHAWQLV